MDKIYDVIIIGGGPAGLTAAIYLARAKKSVLVFEKSEIGGKITASSFVENIPGFKRISGQEFGMNLFNQAVDSGAEVEFDEVVKVAFSLKYEAQWEIFTPHDNYCCKKLIVATGTEYRKLNLKNEDELIGKNIHFCVACDGLFYKGKNVAVIGGGNSAVTEALELSNLCNKVILIQDLKYLTAEKSLIDELNKKQNVEIIYNSIVSEYIMSEENTFKGLMVRNNSTAKKDTIITVDGVFLAIGLIPQNDIFEKLVELNRGFIITDNDKRTTLNPNLYAVGDCTNNGIKQVAIACGEGARAAINIINELK